MSKKAAKLKPDFYKNIKKEYTFELGCDFEELDKEISYQYATPYLGLNFMLSGDFFGGLENHCAYMFGGKRATFKSNIALICAASVLNENEDAYLLFYDSEGVATSDNFIKAGINSSQLVQPRKIVDIEDLTQKIHSDCRNIIQHPDNKDKQFVILIDGIGTITDRGAMEKIVAEEHSKQMGGRAKSLNALANAILPIVINHNVILLTVNHSYSSMGTLYSQEIFKGGENFLNVSNTALLMGKRNLSSDKDVDTKISTGSQFIMRAAKSRNISQDFKLNLDVGYDEGIDPFSGLFDMAVDISKCIIRPTALKYSMVNKDTGEIIPFGDKLDYSRKTVEKDPAFWRVVFKETSFLQDIKEKLSLKEKKLIDEKALSAWDLVNEFKTV